MPKIPSKSKQRIRVNTLKPTVTQNRWVCPTCKTAHRGFSQDFCRNPDCPDKVCTACGGEGRSSNGGLCRICNGRGQRK